MQLTENEINLANAVAISKAGCTAIAAGDVEFDLHAVKHTDSSAVAVLLAWQRMAHQQKRQLRLLGAPASLRSLIALYGLQEFFELAE